MKIRTLFAMLLLVSGIFSYGQRVVTLGNTPQDVTVIPGGLNVNTFLRLPVGDTTLASHDKGRLMYRLADDRLYVADGTRWSLFSGGSGGTETFQQVLINGSALSQSNLISQGLSSVFTGSGGAFYFNSGFFGGQGKMGVDPSGAFLSSNEGGAGIAQVKAVASEVVPVITAFASNGTGHISSIRLHPDSLSFDIFGGIVSFKTLAQAATGFDTSVYQDIAYNKNSTRMERLPYHIKTGIQTETDPVFSASAAAGIVGTDITNWNTAYNDKIVGAAFSGSATKTLTLTQQDGGTVTASFTDNDGGGGSGGTVTSLSSGNLSPLFTTSVATATTTPALSFSLTAAPANTIFGNFTGSSAAPSYNAASADGQFLVRRSGALSFGGLTGADIPSLSTLYVDLVSAQTVGGLKTFTDDVKVLKVGGDANLTIKNNSTTGGANLLLETGSSSTGAPFGYLRFHSVRSIDQEWRMGQYGDENLTLRDFTGAKDVLYITKNTGAVKFSQYTGAGSAIAQFGTDGTISRGMDPATLVLTTGSYADPSWITSLSQTKVLPSQGGHSGEFLTTNGTSSFWTPAPGSGGATLSDGDYGDITVSSSGTAMNVDAGAITLAKMENRATQTFVGRNTAGTGAPEELSIATAKTMLNLTGTNSGDQTITLTGDVTGTGTGSFATAIGTNKVTNTMLAQVATATFKGRVTGGTGNVEDMTATQATSLLNNFTTTLKGLAPASGGGTVNYLRADGTWATPPTGGVTDGDKGDITVSSSGTVWTIDNSTITLAKMENRATQTFLGRNTAGSGAPEELSVSTAKTMLNLTGTNSGDQTITLTGDVTGSGTGSFAATIGSGAVTLAKMENRATQTFIGRNTAGTGVPEELSATTARSILSISNVENTALSTWAGSSNITTLGTIATGTIPWSHVSSTPTTLSGYGITDALSNSNGSLQDGHFTGVYLAGNGAAPYLHIASAETLTNARILNIVTGDATRTLTFAGNATISGTNTGDQTITLTSDVTGSGTGSFATTVAGIKGAAVPTLATGNLRYTGSAWSFDNTTYITGGTNGLTASSANLKLGGTLSENTTISGNTGSFSLTANNLSQFTLSSSAGGVVQSNTLFLQATSGEITIDGGQRWKRTAITANTTLTDGNFYVSVNCSGGSVTVTLPATASKNPTFIIKRTDSSANTVTVQRTGTDTIDGATSITLAAKQSVMLIGDGSSNYEVN
jgi:hypothetical protein